MNNFENILRYISDFAVWISRILLKKSGIRRAFSTGLACVVVFVTTYSLILPAITLENSVATEMPGVYFEEMSDTITINEESDYYENGSVPSVDTNDETWFENDSDEWTDTDDAWVENGSEWDDTEYTDAENGSEEWTDTDVEWTENDAS